MEQEPIGQRIKFLITALDLKVRTFAQALGVGETNIRNYLDRGTKPSSDVLEKIINSFPQVNMVWLITGQGEAFIQTPSTTNDPAAKYQKNISSNVVGNNQGTVTQHHHKPTNLTESANEILMLRTMVEQLQSQLADKERTIQILLKQSS